MFPNNTKAFQRRAFTMTELLIAIVIFIVVILAISQIFATASKVTSVGQAVEDVIQEAAAVERQLRDDIDRISYDGVLVVRSYSVPNNLYGNDALLHPGIDESSIIRSDQLLFFKQGIGAPQTTRISTTATTKGRMLMSRVYWGHGFQLPEWPGYEFQNNNEGEAIDVSPNEVVYPWDQQTSVNAVRTRFATSGAGNVFDSSPAGQLPVNQPEARSWLLCRQAVPMGDDDQTAPTSDSKTVYLSQIMTARSILFDDPLANTCPQLRDGRVDAAASMLKDVRDRIGDYDRDGFLDSWADQRQNILDQLVYFPRADRVGPSMHRVDQALTNHVIGSACSDFRVEWTYGEGAGAQGYLPVSGLPFEGFDPDRGTDIKWFGLENPEDPLPWGARTRPFSEEYPSGTRTINPGNIETYTLTGVPGVRVYEAVFGFNQTQPFTDFNTGLPSDNGEVPTDVDDSLGYTPWPTALRITMTLHDPDGKLENGIPVQFIVNMPTRVFTSD